MSIDVQQQISSVSRKVGSRTLDAGEAKIVTISRSYPTDAADLWDACTNPERIPRWFLPVTGDLRVGGSYQLEGNAGGTVETCNPPESFTATWEFGGDVAGIEVRITPEGEGCSILQIDHIHNDNDHWKQFGPGAVGIGWELALIQGLAAHIDSGEAVDSVKAAAWSASPDGLDFLRKSSEAWHDAYVAAGEDPADARASADRTTAAYTGVPA